MLPTLRLCNTTCKKTSVADKRGANTPDWKATFGNVKNQCLNELLETLNLNKFYNSYFNLNEVQAPWFVLLRNSNSTKLEILEILEPKLGKLLLKLKKKKKKKKKKKNS